MKTPLHDHTKAAIAILLLATVLWSVSGAVFKVLFERTDLTPSALAGYRSLFAGLALMPLAVRRGGLGCWRVQPAKWMIVAVAAFCLMMLTFVSSVGGTTSANAILLFYTAPVWILLLAPWLTGDSTQRRELFSAALGMIGIAVICAGPILAGRTGGGAEMAGILMGLASGASFAVVSIALRRLKNADPFTVTCMNNLVTAAVLLSVAAFQHSLRLTALAATLLIFLGVVQCATPYALYAWALRHVTPQRATLIILTEPILNPIWTWLVVGEIPSTATFIGGAMIIGGLAVMISGSSPAPRQVPVGKPAPQKPGERDSAPTAVR